MSDVKGIQPRSPDWSSDQLSKALQAASKWTIGYRDSIAELPVLPQVQPGDIDSQLEKSPPSTGVERSGEGGGNDR